MLHICKSYARTTDEAQDILQDSFLKVFRNIASYNQNSSLEGWIRKIVNNTAIDYYRSAKRIGYFTPVEEVLNLESGDHDQAAANLNTEDIFKILSELPEGARIIFHLYAVEGYSHKEIAEKLEVSESTSKSQYQRARALLMERLNQREAG